MKKQLDLKKKINALEQQIAELKKRWPAHSVPPAMFQMLEDLEDALELAKTQRDSEQCNSSE